MYDLCKTSYAPRNTPSQTTEIQGHISGCNGRRWLSAFRPQTEWSSLGPRRDLTTKGLRSYNLLSWNCVQPPLPKNNWAGIRHWLFCQVLFMARFHACRLTSDEQPSTCPRAGSAQSSWVCKIFDIIHEPAMTTTKLMMAHNALQHKDTPVDILSEELPHPVDILSKAPSPLLGNLRAFARRLQLRAFSRSPRCDRACAPIGAQEKPNMRAVVHSSSELRPISLLRLSLLRLVDSKPPGNSLWTSEFHPLK